MGRFQFSGDTVEKRIDVLSGGERARLALAKLVLSGANLLLLDEPTSHLDLMSQETLQSALAAFPGTILLVTHDRYLAEALATQIWLVEDVLRVYSGGYRDFQTMRQAEAERRKPAAPPARRQPPRAPSPRQGIRHQQASEERIAALEGDLKRLERELELAAEDVQEVSRLGREYAAVQAALEAEVLTWERFARGEQ